MRHGLSGNKFGRNQTLRAATVRDLSKAVLTHDRITTTRAKAQEARKLVDKLIPWEKKEHWLRKGMFSRSFVTTCW